MIVTVILDCGHSGGATRGEAEVRGMDVVDDKPLLFGQKVIISLETQKSWKEAEILGLKAAGKYVVVAACRQNEFAYEYAFNRATGERNGALTYWLLDTLRQQNAGQTYKDLVDRVRAKINTQFSYQTPILMGPRNRKLFGNELSEEVNAVSVLKVGKNAETNEIEAWLAIGQINGISKGAELAIYPQNTDLKQKENRVAIARIIQRWETDSLCKLEPIEGKEFKVEQGDRAVLVSRSVNLVRKVLLFEQKEATLEEIANHQLPSNELLPQIYKQQKVALEAVKNALSGNGWVELAEYVEDEDDDEGIAYQVALNNEGEYEICDRTGNAYKNIVPVKFDKRDAAKIIVKRLVHLAKFHATAEIDNDPDSPLAGKLSVEWLGTSDTYDTGDPIPERDKLTKFADPNKPTVKVGEYVFLSIRNDSKQTLNVAALNLDAEWAIEQILPIYDSFLTLEAGQEKVVPLKPTLDGNDDSVENTVKVFGTLDAANYRVLELPSLDKPLPSGRGTRSGNSTAALMGAIDDEQLKTRKLTVAASLSTEWTTKQVTLTISK